MRNARLLSSIPEVIAAFGGHKAIARWCGIGPSAISMWLDRQEIPPGWHYRIDREARCRGYEIDPAVFGVVAEQPDPRRLRKQRDVRASV